MLSAYPAVFIKEENGYSVIFPDLNCATSGGDLHEALEMAVDCMAGVLFTWQEEEQGGPLPPPSDMGQGLVDAVCAEYEADPASAFANIVSVDVDAYAKQHFMRSVKKTLTIPAWLNDAAERHGGINYSRLLQNALKDYLGIKTP